MRPLPAAAVGLSFVLSASVAYGQVASRPAADWVTVLDTPERLASMRIPEVVDALDLSPGDVIVDLGAGSGPFVVPFAEAVTASGRVYAVEIDPGFFPYIEARAQATGVTNVQTVRGAFDDPQLPVRDIDVAFMHDVLHHVEHREAYLRNVARYLTPSARIAILDYHPEHSPHGADPALAVSKAQVTAWLGAVGFRPVEDIQLFDDKWFVIYAR